MIVVRWLLSLIFVIQMYLAMAVMAVVFLPWALLSRQGAATAAKAYTNWVLMTARLLCGLRVDVRGEVPQGEVVVAAKHQSFFDILILYNVLPRARFIMKHELSYAPFFGLYALRIGCIPVKRGKRSAALAKLKADVAAGAEEPGQLVIYPQGTRVPPGNYRPYKPGIAVIYQQLEQPCVPVATNCGIFWPKRGILRHPGTAVVEFLPAIAPGLPTDKLLAEVEAQVESHSNRLMAEAGFTFPAEVDPASAAGKQKGA